VIGWLSELCEDKRELLSCAADAQRIAEYALAYYAEFRRKSADALKPAPA
jgi:antirestriction protein ArdC